MMPLPLLFALLVPTAASAGWEGAIVAVDISPSAEQVATNAIYLGGYGALGFRDGLTLGFARGVADPIYARALFVEDGAGQAAAIVVLDAVGLGNVVRDEIRSGVAAALPSLPPERVFVAASHTHCGPDLQGMWGGVPGSYRATAVQGAVDAVRWAAGNRTAVDLLVSSLTDPETAALLNNRRGWGYTQNTSAVLALRAVATGETTGVLVNWGAHPTTLGRSVLELSADFGGYLCRALEAEFPGATALWLNGALGDVTAVASGGGFDRPRSYGEAAAAVAAAAVRSGQTVVGPGLAGRVAAFDEPIENIAFVAAWALGVLDGYYEMTDEPGVNGKLAQHLCASSSAASTSCLPRSPDLRGASAVRRRARDGDHTRRVPHAQHHAGGGCDRREGCGADGGGAHPGLSRLLHPHRRMDDGPEQR